MCFPKIFSWPTPWFWCAIACLVLFANRGIHFGGGVAQICTIVVVASIIYAIRERRTSKIEAAEPDEALSSRLDTIESRLTDTQDVMIALSEKMDRMEDAEVEGNKEAPQS